MFYNLDERTKPNCIAMKLLTTFAFLLSISAYSSSANLKETRKDRSVEKNFTCSILAKNLSEDGTEMSSQRDELLILFYSKNALSVLSEPLVCQDFVFDQIGVSQKFEFSTSQDQEIHIFVIEKDTELSNASLEAIVRLRQKELREAFQAKSSKAIIKILGDDDLLGVTSLESLSKKQKVEISGMQLFDKFHYELEIR